ncbi:hypothetical protein KJZ99_11680 [bacterium]|nr:hypothetical protein [bacterium]
MHRPSAVVALLACLALSDLAVAQLGTDPGKPKKSTTGAVFRSLAVPGWGQLYNEAYLKSAAFLITEASFMIGISRYNDRMMAAKKADMFENERFYRSSRNKMIWWFAAVKLLSLGDAYVDAQLFKIDISPSLTPEESPGMMLSAMVRF